MQVKINRMCKSKIEPRALTLLPFVGFCLLGILVQAAGYAQSTGPAQQKQPSAILVSVEGSDARRDWYAQNATTKGVKAKIMKGLKDWNQVVGISALQNRRLIVRSVC